MDRRHDQTHEKMLKIIHHQGNINQNHNEIQPHTFKMSKLTTQETTDVGKDVERRKPYYTVCGN